MLSRKINKRRIKTEGEAEVEVEVEVEKKSGTIDYKNVNQTGLDRIKPL